MILRVVTGQIYLYPLSVIHGGFLKVHPCEKVIRMFFFQNLISSRLLDINRLHLVCIKRPTEEVKIAKYLSTIISRGRMMKHWKRHDVNFAMSTSVTELWRRWGFFYDEMRNFTQIIFNFTNRRSKCVVSWFCYIILHKWCFRKLYTIK